MLCRAMVNALSSKGNMIMVAHDVPSRMTWLNTKTGQARRV